MNLYNCATQFCNYVLLFQNRKQSIISIDYFYYCCIIATVHTNVSLCTLIFSWSLKAIIVPSEETVLHTMTSPFLADNSRSLSGLECNWRMSPFTSETELWNIMALGLCHAWTWWSSSNISKRIIFGCLTTCLALNQHVKTCMRCQDFLWHFGCASISSSKVGHALFKQQSKLLTPKNMPRHPKFKVLLPRMCFMLMISIFERCASCLRHAEQMRCHTCLLL